MGRRVPVDNISLIGPFLYFSFSFVGLAASIAIITALCSVRFRRKSQPEPQPSTLSEPPLEGPKGLNGAASLPRNSISQELPRASEAGNLEKTTESAENNDEELKKELPLPPAMQINQQQPKAEPSSVVKRATSERRLSFNLSMKMPRSFSMVRNRDQKEENGGGGGGKNRAMKLKADESVWMKTIILGGKCVPDEEEDAVIYEGKGKRISAYHPRSSNSMSLSRQWSSIALDSSSTQPQNHEERISNM